MVAMRRWWRGFMTRCSGRSIRETMLHDTSWDNEWLEIAGPEGVTVAVTVDPKLKPLQGKNIAEIAKAQGKDPIDCILDLLAEDPGMEVVVEGMSQTDVADALKQPWVSVDNDSSGASPEGILGEEHPHPRGYGAFPRILRVVCARGASFDAA